MRISDWSSDVCSSDLIIVFLQSWRAAIIPIVAIPVSLIGTFAVLAGLGYSLNTLSMFGLVLAIGIVVDDAIVVVENVERSEEHTSELQSLMRISYAVFCLKKKKNNITNNITVKQHQLNQIKN